jgi:hypothetical protein
MSVTNEALAERIAGLATLVTEQVGGVRNEVKMLAEHVAIQNGRVGKLETAARDAEVRQKTLQEVATSDRQRNQDLNDRSWTMWQKVLGTIVMIGTLVAGAGGLVEILQHL